MPWHEGDARRRVLRGFRQLQKRSTRPGDPPVTREARGTGGLRLRPDRQPHGRTHSPRRVRWYRMHTASVGSAGHGRGDSCFVGESRRTRGGHAEGMTFRTRQYALAGLPIRKRFPGQRRPSSEIYTLRTTGPGTRTAHARAERARDRSIMRRRCSLSWRRLAARDQTAELRLRLRYILRCWRGVVQAQVVGLVVAVVRACVVA